MSYIKLVIPALFLTLLACNQQLEQADAYGNFEAIEVMVSSESQGQILGFDPMEGSPLQQGQVAVTVDTTQLYLQKVRLESGFVSLGSRIATLEAQVRASQVQLDNLLREKTRIDKLVAGGAATSKQQDDIEGQIALLEAQISTTKSQEASVHAERKTLQVQISQVEDQILKCTIRNPIDGLLLTKYKEQGELTVPGQPLYKMANMDELILRAYVSGSQLSEVVVGHSVKVLYDVAGGEEEIPGTISWVSPRAEFTPKILQTREERVNLVYAIKVRVPNDGKLKIGMPGEVVF